MRHIRGAETILATVTTNYQSLIEQILCPAQDMLSPFYIPPATVQACLYNGEKRVRAASDSFERAFDSI
jgi:hypothetical protein